MSRNRLLCCGSINSVRGLVFEVRTCPRRRLYRRGKIHVHYINEIVLRRSTYSAAQKIYHRVSHALAPETSLLQVDIARQHKEHKLNTTYVHHLRRNEYVQLQEDASSGQQDTHSEGTGAQPLHIETYISNPSNISVV